MPTPENLASQIDRALHDNFVNDIVMGTVVEDADPIDALVIQVMHPNWQENTNLIYALLRYPEAIEAVRLLQEIPRGQLSILLGDSVEFIHIRDVLDSLQ